MVRLESWQIEYSQFLKKSRRKSLERWVEKNIDGIVGLIKKASRGGSDALVFEEADFYVEDAFVKRAGKHHVGVWDMKTGDWAASIRVGGYPCMGVEEVRRLLRKLGLNENSLYGMNVTNEETVGQFIEASKRELEDENLDEDVRPFYSTPILVLEQCMEEGMISEGDGLLDALRKMEQYATKMERAARRHPLRDQQP